MTHSRASFRWQQLVAGLAGGLAGAFAMNAFARIVTDGGATNEATGAAPGGDRIGRGPQPPQAAGMADEDAATRVGSGVFTEVTGQLPDDPTRRWLGSAAHYGFGATAGLCYAALIHRAPAVGAGRGLLYGALVWALADEGLVPALGLSRGPRELPAGVHAYALTSHLVYGSALDAVVRLVHAPRPTAWDANTI